MNQMTDQSLYRRRELVTLLGGAVAASIAPPATGRAQQSDGVKRVAILMSNAENDPEGHARIAAFRRGLEELGWAEGRNLNVEIRWAGADIDRMRVFTAEFIAQAPDLIVGNRSTQPVHLPAA
jgi:putative ABC transport system substrate-binding protein